MDRFVIDVVGSYGNTIISLTKVFFDKIYIGHFLGSARNIEITGLIVKLQ